jgi:hypothetical protein
LSGTYQRVGELFTGSEGSCYGGGKIKGKEVSIPEIKVDTDSAYVQEHVDLIRSVLDGKPLNEAQAVADSTLVAIMGRISAYTGQFVRWNDLVKNENSPFYNFACVPGALDFEKGAVKLAAEVPAVPGA